MIAPPTNGKVYFCPFTKMCFHYDTGYFIGFGSKKAGVITIENKFTRV